LDSFEVTLNTVKFNGTTAKATVKSVYSGKKRPSTVSLVKESGKWKIAAFG